MISLEKKILYRPVVPVSPGETLLEMIESLGMTQKELAERMGRPLKLVNEVIKGKAAVTPETAIQLERVLGKEAVFWTNLESLYRQALASVQAEGALEDEVKKAQLYPYDEMVKNGWVPKAEKPIDMAKNLISFFGVNSLDNVIEKRILEPVLYKISLKKKTNENAAAAWLRQGVVDAQKIQTKKFDEQVLKEKIQEIRALTKEKPETFQDKITSLLADAGVALTITKGLTNVPINGASRWLGSDKALIQLSIYGRSADKFWFSLFHEIGHILLHGKKRANIDISTSVPLDSIEAEANDFAKDILIPREKYVEFVESHHNFTAELVNAFANKIQIHPGIIVGRLQIEERIRFNELNQLRGKLKWA